MVYNRNTRRLTIKVYAGIATLVFAREPNAKAKKVQRSRQGSNILPRMRAACASPLYQSQLGNCPYICGLNTKAVKQKINRYILCWYVRARYYRAHTDQLDFLKLSYLMRQIQICRVYFCPNIIWKVILKRFEMGQTKICTEDLESFSITVSELPYIALLFCFRGLNIRVCALGVQSSCRQKRVKTFM